MHSHAINFLIILKNASVLKKEIIFYFYNKVFLNLAKILYKQGLIQDYWVKKNLLGKFQIIIVLKYSYGLGGLNTLSFISKPSKPIFLTYTEICTLYEKKSLVFFSTNKGFFTSLECKKKKLEANYYSMLNKYQNLFSIDTFIKTINFTDLRKISLIFLKKNRFLVYSNNLGVKKYFLIPKEFNFVKTNLQLSFVYTGSFNLLWFAKKKNFLKNFKSFFLEYQNLKKKFFKRIIIRGVGLKVSLLEENSLVLQLKLGFSHLILLPIPMTLKVFIFKKKIIVEGLNRVEVGNFSKKLQNFKAINIYTGKGLWLKNNSKFKLKSIKKK
jgi:ribosomal protein S8